MNHLWVRPNAIYFQFPFTEIANEIKYLKFERVLCDVKSVLAIKYNNDLIVGFYDDGSIMIKHTDKIIIEELVELIERYEMLIRNYIECFKFKLPEEILEYKMLSTLHKYGKLQGTIHEPLFSDRDCVKELIKYFI